MCELTPLADVYCGHSLVGIQSIIGSRRCGARSKHQKKGVVKSKEKKKEALRRVRTTDLMLTKHTLYQLSYKSNDVFRSKFLS